MTPAELQSSADVSVETRALRMWRFVARVAFWAWVPVMFVVGGTLMVGHWYTLPGPAVDDPVVVQSVRELRAPADAGRWMSVHVMYSKCRCSRRVLDHLFSRPRPEGYVEKLVLVDAHDEFEANAQAAGFAVTVVSPQELKRRFNIQAAPLMMVVDPSDEIRWSGGYTGRKQGLDYRDLHVMRELQAEGDSAAIPLYGCGVSKSLQQALDPLGIKY